MITDFPGNPLTNMAGMQTFSFAPFQNISSLPPVVQNKITAPVAFNGGNRFLLGYSTIAQLDFNEKATTDENGSVYDWTITGYTPGDSDFLSALMADMMRCRQLVVLVQDNNGLVRLVGYNAPLEFSYIYDSGKIPGSDPRGYAFTFFGRGGASAPVYQV